MRARAKYSDILYSIRVTEQQPWDCWHYQASNIALALSFDHLSFVLGVSPAITRWKFRNR